MHKDMAKKPINGSLTGLIAYVVDRKPGFNAFRSGQDRLLSIKKYYDDPLYRNSVAIMATSILSSLFGVVFWIVAAKTMPAEDIGLTSTISSMTVFITIVSTLGMDVALIRNLPSSKNKVELASTVIISIVLISIILAVLFVINLKFLAPQLLFLQQAVPFIVFFTFVVFSSANIMLGVVFTTMRKSGVYFTQNIILGLRVPIIYLIAPFGILGALASFSISYLVSSIFGIYMLYKNNLPLKPIINRTLLNNILSYSLGNYAASIFTLAPGMVMPIIIVNTLGAAESAYYFIAYSIASILFMIPNAIASSLFIEGSYDTPLKKNIIKSLKFILLLMVPLTVLIFLFGDKLLLVFSKEYSEQSFDLLKLFALSSLPSSIMWIYIVVKRIQKNIFAINSVSFIAAAMIIVAGYITLIKFGLMELGYIWLVIYLGIGVTLGIILYHDVFLNRSSVHPVKSEI